MKCLRFNSSYSISAWCLNKEKKKHHHHHHQQQKNNNKANKTKPQKEPLVTQLRKTAWASCFLFDQIYWPLLLLRKEAGFYKAEAGPLFAQESLMGFWRQAAPNPFQCCHLLLGIYPWAGSLMSLILNCSFLKMRVLSIIVPSAGCWKASWGWHVQKHLNQTWLVVSTPQVIWWELQHLLQSFLLL